MLADLIGRNRQLSEEILLRVRRLEIGAGTGEQLEDHAASGPRREREGARGPRRADRIAQ
jgi:hypothetical protein